MLIVGVGLASSALFQGYQQFFAGGRTIEMPDEVLGMERIDPDSDLGRQLEASQRQLPTLPGGEELQSAAYISGSGVLLVAAGESASSAEEVDDFFADFGTEMTQVAPELTLSEVDPGLLGGNMRCTANNPQAIGICAWVDRDTVGVVFVAAAGLDVTDTARQVREAIEH